MIDNNSYTSINNNLSTGAESGSRQNAEENMRSCWVCFATDGVDNTDPYWVQPCLCRGTTKWVHQSCLQRWVDEKQRGNSLAKVSCPQCNTSYVIVFPSMGPLVVFLDTVDAIILKLCPFLAAGVLAGALYWTAITYGAVTIMQVVGHEEGLAVMGQAHSLILIVGLPAIPIMLVFGKMVRWEETALILLRRYTTKMPMLRYILPSFVYHEELENHNNSGIPTLSDTICATRVFCSALLLPTIATFIGRMFFESIPSKVQRTFLGGITFIVIKGLFRIYHKQQKFVQKKQRKVLDYPADLIPNRRPKPVVPTTAALERIWSSMPDFSQSSDESSVSTIDYDTSSESTTDSMSTSSSPERLTSF